METLMPEEAKKQSKKQPNLFTVIQSGQKKIMRSHRKAIILVGLTRIGKSTTFNWMLRRPMIGKGKLHSTYIQTVQDDSDSAKLGSEFVSVTLEPNVYTDFTQHGESLIDMAGYFDTRDTCVGVIGVSYFLKSVFQTVREAKFVIVFNEHKLSEENGKGIINTFLGFINMFKFDKMTKPLKEKLKRSMCVVITRSKSPNEHYDYLMEIKNNINHPNLNVPHKELVIELIDYICTSSKFQAFKSAVQSQNPEECTFTKRLNQKYDWAYFNLDDADEELGQSVISIPFNKEYETLNEVQKNNFNTTIEKRISSYEQFNQVLTTFLATITGNWNSFIAKWKEEIIIDLSSFNMKTIFQKIQDFLDANDVYNSAETIQVKFKASYEPCTFIQTVNTALKAYDQTDKMGHAEIINDFNQQMTKLSQNFSTLVQCLKPFCYSQQDQKLICRLKYIIGRGFKQFIKLYQLNPECIHNVKLTLKDKCLGAFETSKKNFMQMFIKEMTSQLLTRLFPSLHLLEQYEQFFLQYQLEFRDCDRAQKPFFFSQQRCKIDMAKADILLANGEKERALHCYINALINQDQMMTEVANQNQNENSEKEQKLNDISMRKLKLSRRITEILKTFPQNQNFFPKSLALRLCIHTKMIDDVCQIYQLILDSPKTPINQKSKIYEDFAMYSAKWGRVEQAYIILQKKLSFEENDYYSHNETINLMKELMKNSADYMKEFRSNLNSWSRLPTNDSFLRDLLGELASQVRIPVPNETQ